MIGLSSQTIQYENYYILFCHHLFIYFGHVKVTRFLFYYMVFYEYFLYATWCIKTFPCICENHVYCVLKLSEVVILLRFLSFV